jgi:predicted outer membrane lipoprotein
MEGHAQAGNVARDRGAKAVEALRDIRGRMLALRQVSTTDLIGVELGRAYAIVNRLLLELGDDAAAGDARK